jgi:porin
VAGEDRLAGLSLLVSIRRVLVGAAGFISAAVAMAGAQTEGRVDPSTHTVAAVGGLVVSAHADEISHQLDRRAKLRVLLHPTPLIEGGIAAWTNATGWIDHKVGLRFGVSYDTLVQGATEANGDALAAGGDLTLLGQWTVWGQSQGYEGSFGFNGRNRLRFARTPPSALGASIGSLWSTTDGFTDKGWELPEAWFEQKAWDGRIALRTGQLNIRTLFDTASLRSARLYFLNTAFSLNPAIPFPLFGAGTAVFVKPLEDLELRFGAADAHARKIDGPFDTLLRSDDVFVVAGLSWTPKWNEEGHSRIQATGWHTDSTKSNVANDGEGLSVLMEQRFDESGATLFLRGAWSDSRATVIDSMVTAGAGWIPAAGRPADLLGMAFGWGRPHDRWLHDEGVMEVFYRVQVSAELQLTPDVQVIVHPSTAAAADVVTVFGVRVRTAF